MSDRLQGYTTDRAQTLEKRTPEDSTLTKSLTVIIHLHQSHRVIGIMTLSLGSSTAPFF